MGIAIYCQADLRLCDLYVLELNAFTRNWAFFTPSPDAVSLHPALHSVFTFSDTVWIPSACFLATSWRCSHNSREGNHSTAPQWSSAHSETSEERYTCGQQLQCCCAFFTVGQNWMVCFLWCYAAATVDDFNVKIIGLWQWPFPVSFGNTRGSSSLQAIFFRARHSSLLQKIYSNMFTKYIVELVWCR